MAHIVRQREPNEPRIIPSGEPVIVAEGRIGAIVQFPVLVDEGSGYISKSFEKFVRPPGTRIIAIKDNTIFLQQEARLERNNIPDWRLPGGKVVDTFVEYKKFMSGEIPESIIIEAAKKELFEEAKLESNDVHVFSKKECGATVEWDLYYVIARNAIESTKQNEHEEGEDIRNSNWFSFEEVLEKCKTGEISEGRTVAVLFEFIHKQ